MPHKVKMFALSTCGWCKKTKDLLHSLGVGYELQEVDLLEGEEEKVRQELAGYNPKRSYPTVVVDEQVIVGFDEERLRQVFS